VQLIIPRRGAASVISRVCDCVSVCLCVHAPKGKRIELSTPNSTDLQCMAVARHALTLRSKGQKVKWSMVTRLSDALPAWVCMSTGLFRFSSCPSVAGVFNILHSPAALHVCVLVNYLPKMVKSGRYFTKTFVAIQTRFSELSVPTQRFNSVVYRAFRMRCHRRVAYW